MTKTKRWKALMLGTAMTAAVVMGAGEAAFAEADGLIVEDNDEENVSQEGELLEDVLAREQEEAEREAAQKEAQALIQDADRLVPEASAERLETLLEELTAQPDPTGSDGELAMSAYIEGVMEEIGYTVTEQAFHEGVLNEDGVDLPGINIIAERGADAEDRSKDIVILAVHYDSVSGVAEDAKVSPATNDKTGAAVAIECARVLASLDTECDVCFLFLSGEEDGLHGSREFVRSMSEENRERVRAVIALDTVGTDSDADYVTGTLDGSVNDPAMYLQAAQVEVTGTAVTEDDKENAAPSADAANTELSAIKRTWKIAEDDSHSHKAFAEAQFPSVILYQEIPEEELAQAKADPEALAQVADIVAACLNGYMSGAIQVNS